MGFGILTKYKKRLGLINCIASEVSSWIDFEHTGKLTASITLVKDKNDTNILKGAYKRLISKATCNNFLNLT